MAAGLRWEDFGTPDNCWLSNRHFVLWSFVGPVLGIIAVNLVVFVMVMRNILRVGRRKVRTYVLASSWSIDCHTSNIITNQVMNRRSSASSDERSRTIAQVSRGIKATLSFFCLLGVTWVFGALAIGGAALFFIYLFSICNALQGLFIFIFHCASDTRSGPSSLEIISICEKLENLVCNKRIESGCIRDLESDLIRARRPSQHN